MAKKDIPWSKKCAILLETKSEGKTLMGVARKHELQPQTLRRWKRELADMPPTERLGIFKAFRIAEAEADEQMRQLEYDEACLGLPPAPPYSLTKDELEVLAWHDEAMENPDYFTERRTHPEGKFIVEIHGKLPRGEFDFMQLALPRNLRHQLEQSTRGSKTQVIIQLVRYALEDLSQKRQSLHVYNEIDQALSYRSTETPRQLWLDQDFSDLEKILFDRGKSRPGRSAQKVPADQN